MATIDPGRDELANLAETGRAGASFDRVTTKLRDSADRLKSRGVSHLWGFGSVARGEAGQHSDVDLLAEFDPTVPIGLVTLASLRAELSDLLGMRADLVERSSPYPAVRETAERDAIRVL